ncbi:EF-hand calcium-binding domain-containing protein 7-like [Argiope bruennichi]|uniref:EF-hand calcium-binding domain-containing protein 7-like n=1 Tax=Argiope bruennichi TaxID=94029 RepID=UPI00249472B4|nr:EF-hand calcium-binding domain-containing protein 7-like [Argiope bruennichi]
MDMMESLNNNDVNFIERFLHAFKMLGGSELGVIDFDHFKQILEQENSADAKEILDLIKTENHVKDNKLDFVSLCSSILSIKGIFNSALENGKVAIQGPGINTRTFTRNKGSAKTSNSPYDKTISTQKSLNKFLKGVLFHVDGDMLSYRYQLEVLENTVVEIFVTAITDKGETTPNIPVEVLIFQDGKNKTFITSSSFLNEDGFCTVKYALKKGKYILIPILLKWDMLRKSNSFDRLNLDSLIHVEEDSSVILTSACERSLKTIFDCIDLDENGLLNPTEFDYFIRHVSGETAAEEWNTVEDNFKTENQQLTFEGFVELYRLVLQTDPTDVMSMLQHMGMNETLELENALPFRLAVKSVSGKFNLLPLPVSSYKEVAEKVLRKVAVEQGVSKKVRNMNDLFVFIHRLPYRATLVIQNQSHSRVKIRLDCSKSVNCASHYGRLDFTFNVLPRTCITGHHLFPVDPSKEWTVECTEYLL